MIKISQFWLKFKQKSPLTLGLKKENECDNRHQYLYRQTGERPWCVLRMAVIMKVTILTPARTLYDGEAWSVFLPGTEGEFEIMDNHKPIMSLLKEGQIVLDWKKTIPLKKGIVKMFHNEVVALIEEGT